MKTIIIFFEIAEKRGNDEDYEENEPRTCK